MGSVLWVVLPYCAFVSFFVGHVWRWHHDRFDPGTSLGAAGRARAMGARIFGIGVLMVVGVRITQALTITDEDSRPARAVCWTIAGVEMVALPASIIGAMILLLPTVLSAEPRRVVTPLDRITIPVLLAGVTSGVIVDLAPDPFTSANHAAATLFVWFRSLFTVRPRPDVMVHAPLLYQIRGLIVLLMIGIWPYTRVACVYGDPLVRLSRKLLRRSIFGHAREPRGDAGAAVEQTDSTG